MKVYVITKGIYSDYHICAVATDPDKAEKLAKIYGDRYDTAEVEVFDTEEHRDWLIGRVPFEVIFFRGMAPSVWLLEAGTSITPGVKVDPSVLSVEMKVYLYAPDRDTALKIAQDKRAEYLAQQAGL